MDPNFGSVKSFTGAEEGQRGGLDRGGAGGGGFIRRLEKKGHKGGGLEGAGGGSGLRQRDKGGGSNRRGEGLTILAGGKHLRPMLLPVST